MVGRDLNSPWKVGITGGPGQSEATKSVAANQNCQCAPALAACNTGCNWRRNTRCDWGRRQSQPVLQADIASAHRRCRTNPNFPQTVKPKGKKLYLEKKIAKLKPKGCSKNNVAFFSANFRRQYLGDGLSDLLKNLCAKSPHWPRFAH